MQAATRVLMDKENDARKTTCWHAVAVDNIL